MGSLSNPDPASTSSETIRLLTHPGVLSTVVRGWAPAIAATVGLIVLAMASWIFIGSSGFGYDFRAYDDAARRLAAGASIYLPGTVEAYQQGRYEGLYLYPPPLVVALLPLTLLDQHAATLAWLVLRIVLLIGGCLALPVSMRARLATVAVAGVSFPVLFDLNIGNVSVVVFTLCAFAWRWMESPIGAIAHAALIALRFPFGLFALTWIVQRQYRLLARTVVAGLGILIVTMPLVGVGSYADYLAILRGLPDISTGEHNLSLKSFALGLGLADPFVALALPIGYLLGVAAVVFGALRRDASTAFVLTTTATLLLSPFIHPHYLVLLLIPSAWLMDRGHWWAFALPLLGWLPDAWLPLAGPLAIGLVLALSERSAAGTRAS